jgi:hypothetical protein
MLHNQEPTNIDSVYQPNKNSPDISSVRELTLTYAVLIAHPSYHHITNKAYKVMSLS